jgi:hypothetical protein
LPAVPVVVLLHHLPATGGNLVAGQMPGHSPPTFGMEPSWHGAHVPSADGALPSGHVFGAVQFVPSGTVDPLGHAQFIPLPSGAVRGALPSGQAFLVVQFVPRGTVDPSGQGQIFPCPSGATIGDCPSGQPVPDVFSQFVPKGTVDPSPQSQISPPPGAGSGAEPS